MLQGDFFFKPTTSSFLRAICNLYSKNTEGRITSICDVCSLGSGWWQLPALLWLLQAARPPCPQL